MSMLSATENATTKPPSSAPQSAPPLNLKPRRLLACVLCQQRKVKCDHNYPCATCVKARVPCIQANQVTRRRKRRFPERELLEQIRTYEELLSQHNIKFESLHSNNPPVAEKGSPASNLDGSYDSGDEPGTGNAVVNANSQPPKFTPTSEQQEVYESRRILHALSNEYRENKNDDSSDDEVRQDVFKNAWDQAIVNDDYLLFGPRRTDVEMYTLHPQPVQIFQLWQLYLDNVNPLLKITHAPSLQGRIIQAASNILDINPELEALMFGIYCMAIFSLTEDDCQGIFTSSRADLLSRYRFGCQQALLNSRFLRTSNRDCLTSLYLYLLSVKTLTGPQSLSSMLGAAIRIAQRMGIHSESHLTKSTVLEAEMSRRLWWSLILFDTRIGEMADSKSTSLIPTWDCRVPLNVNDSDLQNEMKESPRIQGKTTDALFAVVRSEFGDFVRHTQFYLAFFGPARKPIQTGISANTEDGEMENFAKIIEDKYLGSCDPNNPLHFITIWTTRANLAKFKLIEHHFKYSGSPLHQAETQRNAALSYALNMLECNTELMSSPLTKGFHWMVYSYFPFMGYIQIVQHLKWRPMSVQAEKAWRVMSDNFSTRQESLQNSSSFFKLLTGYILQAWEAREAAFNDAGEEIVIPQIVVSIKHSLAQMASNGDNTSYSQLNDAMNIEIPNFPLSIPMGFGGYGPVLNMGGYDDHTLLGQGEYSDGSGLSLQNVDLDRLDWSAMD